jgi:hypothetical protein
MTLVPRDRRQAKISPCLSSSSGRASFDDLEADRHALVAAIPAMVAVEPDVAVFRPMPSVGLGRAWHVVD